MTDEGDTRRQSSPGELQPAPNATMWGFAIEALHLLYRIGPATVVVAGFLVFGYFFYQEVNRAKQEADAQLLERLKTSQEQLVATYEKMGGMSDKLIENVKNLLDLSDRIDKDIEANRTRLRAFEKAAEDRVREAEDKARAVEDEVTKARAAADAALADVAARGEEIAAQQAALERREAELQDQLAALEDQRKALEVEVSKLRGERQKLRSDLTDAAAQIAQLRPEAMAASGDGDPDGPSIDQILRQRLAAFAADPAGANLDELNALIGLEVAQVVTLTGGNADYAAWLQLQPKGGDLSIDDTEGLIGVVGDSPSRIDASLFIEVREGRVIGVDAIGGLIVTRLPKADNWYATWTVALADTAGEFDAVYIDREFGSWTLSDIFESVETDVAVQVIAGSERRKSVASLSDVEAFKPDAYSGWAAESDPFGRPAVILRMMERAMEFRAASIPAIETMSPELREAFTRLAEAAVLDRREIVAEHADPKLDHAQIGALAALVLRDDVRVDDVDEIEVSDRGGNPIGRQASVILRFADLDAKGGVRPATLSFDRSSGRWMLTSLSIAYR